MAPKATALSIELYRLTCSLSLLSRFPPVDGARYIFAQLSTYEIAMFSPKMNFFAHYAPQVQAMQK